MSIFSYTALDQNNKYVKSSIEAKNRKKALKSLEADGLLVVNINQNKVSWLNKISAISTIARVDKIFFTRHLHTLVESGIALDQSIKICAEQSTNNAFKKVLLDIYEKVKRGESLSNALAGHKKYFSNFYINLIKVGEKSGTLDDVLQHLLEQQEQDYELITKTRGAMIYPGVIISAAIIIVILMLIFVIPSITGILVEYNVELPLPTKILIFVSNTLSRFGVAIASLLILMAFLLRRWTKTARGKYVWDSFKLKSPILSGIVKEFNLARFCRSMSALLKSGVSVDDALKLSASICGNTFYKNSINAAVPIVRKGIPLTEILSGYPKLYPAITTRMLEVGEKTGKFEHMFTRLAVFYEKSVLNTITNMSSVLEPILLLVIGCGVAFVAVSVLTPIWKFAQTI